MKQYISSLPIEMAMTKAGNIFGLNLYLLTETNPVNMAYNGYNIETSIPLTYDPEELSKFEYFFSVTWPNFWGSPRGKLLAFVLFIVALALSFITGTYAFFMFTLKISTIFLLAGAAISGVTSLIKGGSFGDEFVEYINNNWAQSLAITSALFIISVGVSSIVKLAKPQCFKAGTKVLTSEGNKNIEDVKVGDKVWSYNEETKEKELKEVVRLYRNGEEYTTNDDIGEGVKEWIKVGILSLKNNDLITCTAGHPFYVLNESSERDTITFNESNEKNQQLEGSWIASKDLRVGDELLLSNGENAIISSVDVEYLDEPETTYNFEVEISLPLLTRSRYDKITANEEQSFNVEGKGLIDAKDIKVGDKIILENGDAATILSLEVKTIGGPQTTYNFEVADFHTYYVGENGVLVHNACAGGMADEVGNSVDDMLQFKSRAELETHFAKHGSQFKGMYANADEYLAGANKVIQNGVYNTNLNSYMQFYRVTSKGQNLYHFVGITRGSPTYITTYFPKTF